MKKRVMLTLTVEPYNELKEVIKALGLPSSMTSTICDEAIAKVLPIFKQVQSTGKYTLTDLFTTIGNEIEEGITRKEGLDVQTREETKSVKKRIKS